MLSICIPTRTKLTFEHATEHSPLCNHGVERARRRHVVQEIPENAMGRHYPDALGLHRGWRKHGEAAEAPNIRRYSWSIFVIRQCYYMLCTPYIIHRANATTAQQRCARSQVFRARHAACAEPDRSHHQRLFSVQRNERLRGGARLCQPFADETVAQGVQDHSSRVALWLVVLHV